MIKTFRHKGLKPLRSYSFATSIFLMFRLIDAICLRAVLFEQDEASGVNPEHVSKLQDILAVLHAAPTVAHMDLPGFRVHSLKGRMKGIWAVTVRANWRVIFRFTEGSAEDVDYVDYH